MIPEIIEVPVKPARSRWVKLGLISEPASVAVVPEIRIRRFSDAALQGQIDKLLEGLPADTRAVEVEIGADQMGVQVVGAVRLKQGWSILGGVAVDYSGTWGGKVGFRRVW